MAFAENLDDFFDVTDGHAITVTIGGASVSAIWDNESGDELLAAGSRPSLIVKSADVSSTARNTVVVVDGVNYRVASVDPDGTGLSRVPLEKT